MRDNREGNRLYKKYIAEMAASYRARSDIRAFVEFLLTSVAIFVFGVFAVRPTLVTIGGLTTQISEKRQTIATLDDKINNIIKAQQVYSEQSARLALLDTAVPSQPNLPPYIKQIEQVTKTHSLTIFSMSTQGVPVLSAPEEAGAEQSLNFSITLTGSYADLVSAVADLENMRRPILPATSSMSVDDSSGTSTIYLTITGNIPYFPAKLVNVTP